MDHAFFARGTTFLILFAPATHTSASVEPFPATAAALEPDDAGDNAAGMEDESLRQRVLLGSRVGTDGALRGDFVPPDAMLIAYEEAWINAVEAVLRVTVKSTSTYVLVSQSEARDASIVTWARAFDVTLVPVALDTPWVRDYGPLQRVSADGSVLWMDYHYGPGRPKDDDVPQLLSGRFGAVVDRSSVTLDGGAVVSNGSGLCSITDRSLDEAGVDADDDDSVAMLLGSLGCEVAAVIPDIEDEPTGHADMIVQFVSRDRAIVAELDPADHPDEAHLLDSAARVLALAASAAGQPLSIVRVPAEFDDSEGTLFSFVNGTRLENAYLMPWFSSIEDSLAVRAEAALRAAMPGVSLVTIPSDDLASSGGLVHCITLGLSITQ